MENVKSDSGAAINFLKSYDRGAGIVALQILPAVYDAGVSAEILGNYRYSVIVMQDTVARFETRKEAEDFCRSVLEQLPAAARFQGHY